MRNGGMFKKVCTGIALLIAVIVIPCLPVCVHVELPHEGIVRDAETKAPLKDAAAVLDLDYSCFFPPEFEHITHHLATLQAITEAGGGFATELAPSLIRPPCLLDDKRMIFFKPGYFPAHTAVTKTADLYRMNYYLNYLPYRDPMDLQSSIDHPESDSSYMTMARKINENMPLVRAGDTGVFLKLGDKQFRQIYALKDMHYGSSSWNDITLYAFDQKSGQWLAFDARGVPRARRSAGYPAWSFLDSNDGSRNPIYASADSIFYATDENDFALDEGPICTNYPCKGNVTVFGEATPRVVKKLKFQYISPGKGNISALAGDVQDFVTIEGNGSSLCEYERSYARYGDVDFNSPPKPTAPRAVRCFTAEDFPVTGEDEEIKNSQFKYLRHVDNSMSGKWYLVLTKTASFWHLYALHGIRGQNETNVPLKEIMSFPAETEITDFTVTPLPNGGLGIYIAFADDGIRKYVMANDFKLEAKEDASFFRNSRAADYPNITSLAIGSAVNSLVVYAATGEDKIYRFSLEGMPDYQVQQEGN